MRRLFPFSMLLIAILSVSGGCSTSNEPSGSLPGPGTINVPQGPTVVVFRGTYYRSKECREMGDKSTALGLWNACDVVEVLQGELKMQCLLGVRIPEDLEEGTYTFRWELTDSLRDHLRKAEAGRYTRIWVDGEKLQLVAGGKFGGEEVLPLPREVK